METINNFLIDRSFESIKFHFFHPNSISNVGRAVGSPDSAAEKQCALFGEKIN